MSPQHRTRRRALVACAVVVALLALVWLVTRGEDRPTTVGPYVPKPQPSVTLDPAPTPTAPPGADGLFPGGLPSGIWEGVTFPGGFQPDAEHRVVLTVSAPKGSYVQMGYRVREDGWKTHFTSMEGGTWTRSFTMRGSPLFAMMGVRYVKGGPVTCKTTVDGREITNETETRPYYIIVCGG